MSYYLIGEEFNAGDRRNDSVVLAQFQELSLCNSNVAQDIRLCEIIVAHSRKRLPSLNSITI